MQTLSLQYERAKAIYELEKIRSKIIQLKFEGIDDKKDQIKSLQEKIEILSAKHQPKAVDVSLLKKLKAELKDAEEELAKAEKEMQDTQRVFSKQEDTVRKIENKVKQHKELDVDPLVREQLNWVKLTPRQKIIWILVENTLAAHDNLALAYIHKGDKRSAAEVHYRLGILFDKIEWNNFAIAEFIKGASIDPKPSADTYNLLGKLYGEIGNYEQARQIFTKTLEITPDSASIHTNLGLVHLKQGLEKEAKKEFQRAIELEPDFIEARQNLAVYYYEIEDYKNALKQWKNIHKINPDYPNLKKNIELAKKKIGPNLIGRLTNSVKSMLKRD